MIRFVDLGRQLWVNQTDEDCPRQFCFYDTVNDKFISIGGQQVFNCWTDFIEQVDVEMVDHKGAAIILGVRPLCAEWVFEDKKKENKHG